MTTMHAVRAHVRGGAEQMRLDDVPKPEPRHGEALIRVHAAGITPTELAWSETWIDRQGHDRTPTIPSHEVSGVVEELGDGVTHVATAYEFARTGRRRGKVVVQVASAEPKLVEQAVSATAG